MNPPRTLGITTAQPTPVTPEPPPPAREPEPEISEENIDYTRAVMLNKMFGTPMPPEMTPAVPPVTTDVTPPETPPVPPVATEPPHAAPPEGQAPPTPVTPPAPATTPPAPAPQTPLAPPPVVPPPLSIPEIAERALAQVPPQQQPELDAEDQEIITGIRRMEKDNPAKYTGLESKVMNFWAREAAYIEAWEKSNPGQQYDLDSPDHEQFYASEPKYSERELDRALRNIEWDEREEKIRQDNDRQIKKVESRYRMKEVEPQIRNAASQAITMMVADTVPELVVKDGKIDHEAIKKIEEADPIAHEILMDEAEGLNVVATEIQRLQEFGNDYGFNLDKAVTLKSKEKIYPHKLIAEFATEIEGHMMSLPPEQTMRDGRRFVPHAEMQKHIDTITRGKSEKESQAIVDRLNQAYYTLTYQDLMVGFVSKTSLRAKEKIQKIRSYVDKSKTKGAAVGQNPAPVTPPAPAPEPPPAPPKPRSPSVTTSSDTANVGPASKSGGGLTTEMIINKTLGR